MSLCQDNIKVLVYDCQSHEWNEVSKYLFHTDLHWFHCHIIEMSLLGKTQMAHNYPIGIQEINMKN